MELALQEGPRQKKVRLRRRKKPRDGHEKKCAKGGKTAERSNSLSFMSEPESQRKPSRRRLK